MFDSNSDQWTIYTILIKGILLRLVNNYILKKELVFYIYRKPVPYYSYKHFSQMPYTSNLCVFISTLGSFFWMASIGQNSITFVSPQHSHIK